MNRLLWIQVALLTVGTTAMLWGALANIGWLFWGIGLPVEIIAFVYTIIAASILADESR